MSFLLDHFPYALLMCISGGVFVWPSLEALWTGGHAVSTHEATVLMNQKKALILDIRNAEDFASGHISGARHIPAAELKTRIMELQRFRSRPIVVVGDPARPALALLKSQGYQELAQLKGGMRAWLDAGLPTDTP